MLKTRWVFSEVQSNVIGKFSCDHTEAHFFTRLSAQYEQILKNIKTGQIWDTWTGALIFQAAVVSRMKFIKIFLTSRKI